jgi:hypothetical protein
LAVRVEKRRIALQMKEVVRIESPKNALVEPIHDLLDSQIVDPGIQNPALLPGWKS